MRGNIHLICNVSGFCLIFHWKIPNTLLVYSIDRNINLLLNRDFQFLLFRFRFLKAFIVVNQQKKTFKNSFEIDFIMQIETRKRFWILIGRRLRKILNKAPKNQHGACAVYCTLLVLNAKLDYCKKLRINYRLFTVSCW